MPINLSRIRVVPPPLPAHGDLTPVQGTRVFAGDEDISSSVSKITITAAADDVWRVRVECFGVLDGEVTSLADDYVAWQNPPTLAQALRAWWDGRFNLPKYHQRRT